MELISKRWEAENSPSQGMELLICQSTLQNADKLYNGIFRMQKEQQIKLRF